MFKCKNCGKEFPVVAWIEMATTTYPTFPNWQGANSVTVNVTWTYLQSTTTMKKPVCPYCQQLDLEEILAMKDEKEWWEYLDWSEMSRTFKQLSDSTKKRILERGYWSCGKGNFADIKS